MTSYDPFPSKYLRVPPRDEVCLKKKKKKSLLKITYSLLKRFFSVKYLLAHVTKVQDEKLACSRT